MQDKTIEPTLQTEIPPYEAPTIIYEGDVSTRAGSGFDSAGPDAGESGVDLFGD